MLFVESKTSAESVAGPERLPLLEKLREKGLTPLIRSARLSGFEVALLGPDQVPELERAMAEWSEKEWDAPYVQGDVFCFEDFVLFLIFRDGKEERGGMRAGIVYETETTEPLKKLDAFCRNVRDALETARGGTGEEPAKEGLAEWQPRKPHAVDWRAHFADRQEREGFAARQREGGEELRGLELLEDAGARRLLRRLSETQTATRAAKLLAGDGSELATDSMVIKLSNAGLLRREVSVSCRKAGHALFRLPSPDALAVVTASNAICSECGAAIADEKVEDVIAPTDTAAALLEDGSWLANRLRRVLGELGIPAKQVAVRQASADGEAHMMVNLSNELFFLVLRDGDLTGAHARRALDMQTGVEGAHLIVVATGVIQDEARLRLREHARRRARHGSDVEVILVEGLDAVATELRRAFERVSQRALAEELYALNASLGLSVDRLITLRFRLMQRPGAVSDTSESAVGAVAGSLRKI